MLHSSDFEETSWFHRIQSCFLASSVERRGQRLDLNSLCSWLSCWYLMRRNRYCGACYQLICCHCWLGLKMSSVLHISNHRCNYFGMQRQVFNVWSFDFQLEQYWHYLDIKEYWGLSPCWTSMLRICGAKYEDLKHRHSYPNDLPSFDWDGHLFV